MGMFDYIKSDYLLPLTEEIKMELPEQDWSEIEFQTKSLGCDLQNYSIEEDGQIYIDKKSWDTGEDGQLIEINEGIERLEWTGEIDFYFDFFKKEHDLWIEFKALVWKGDLKEIELTVFKKVSNETRLTIQKNFEEALGECKVKRDAWWWKLIRVWRSMIRVPLFIIRWVLGLIVRLTWKIERWLTFGHHGL